MADVVARAQATAARTEVMRALSHDDRAAA
jgi:hypothetical protein